MKIKNSLSFLVLLWLSLTILVSGCVSSNSKVIINNVFEAAKRGDVVDMQQFSSSINQTTYHYWRPIHLACVYQPKKKSLIKYLIDNGADVNAKDIKGRTPLHLMAIYSPENNESFQLLISKGADVNAKDGKGQTPLHRMAIYSPENNEILQLLISKGADVNVKDKKGRTPLHLMVRYSPENNESFQLLISKGVDVNVKDKKGRTPLNLMARYDPANNEILQLLISKGADVNAKNYSGQTPLHLMAIYGPANNEILQLLISKGADVNAKNIYGRRPIDLTSNGKAKKLLRERKAYLDRMLPIYVNKGQWNLVVTAMFSGADVSNIIANQSCDQYKEQHNASLKEAIDHIKKKKYKEALISLNNNLEALFYTNIKRCQDVNTNKGNMTNFDEVIKKSIRLYNAIDKKIGP